MPITLPAAKVSGIGWNGYGEEGYKSKEFNVTAAQRFRAEQGVKVGGDWFSDPNSPLRTSSSKSDSRKAARAMIAKIPEPLSRHIARCYYPR